MEMVVLWLQLHSNPSNGFRFVKGPDLNRLIVNLPSFAQDSHFNRQHLVGTQGVCAANFKQIAPRAVVLWLIFCHTSFMSRLPTRNCHGSQKKKKKKKSVEPCGAIH